MAEGIKFGRKPKLTRHQAREALKRVAAGEPMREIALSYAIDHSTISQLNARQLPRWCDRPGGFEFWVCKHRRMGGV